MAEAVGRVMGFLLVMIVHKKSPLWLYGTSNIEVIPSFIKCFFVMGSVTWLHGPFTLWIRTKLAPNNQLAQKVKAS